MTSHRFTWKPVATMLGAALALRFLLAYVILPDSGAVPDNNSYKEWGLAVAAVGPREFYARSPLVDYPPGYLYVLGFLASVSHTVASITGGDIQRIMSSLIKVPPMLFDIGVGFLLYSITKRWRSEETRCEALSLAAAALYLFNPVALYDSAVWGQSDAAGAFLMLLAVKTLFQGPPEAAASIAAVAALTKPQFGVILVPLIGIVLLRRYLRLRKYSGQFSEMGEVWSVRNGPIRILTSALVALAVFYTLALPFSLDLRTYFLRMADTAEFYHYFSANAFNPWALVGSGGNPPLVLAGLGNWSRDDTPLVGPFSGVEIGSALLACGFLLGGLRLAWRSDRLSVVLVGAFLCLCFFTLPTRVHERYLFPTFAFASLLSVSDRRWLLATGALAVGSLMNLQAVLSQIGMGTDNITSLPLSEFLKSPRGILISIVLQTSVFFFAAGRVLSGFIKFSPFGRTYLPPAAR